MDRWPHVAVAFAALLLANGCDEAAPNPPDAPEVAESVDPLTTPVGTVHFPASCVPRAAALVERGVALLHHMMYENADFVFRLAAQEDPACALAYWGQAMTRIHPLWPDRPSQETIADGRALVAKAQVAGTRTAREAGYLATVAAYFEGEDAEPERLARFEEAWRRLAEAHPDDLEARAFHALALLGTARPEDKSYVKQRRAGQMVADVLTRIPDHPGAHHYTIHAYDYPGLAAQALPVADAYGRIAPRVPHATHMMTHIYTRLGHWEQAIEWNRRSADAAWELCTAGGEVLSHYPHALDYLAYALLQRAEDEAALEIVRAAQALEPPFNAVNPDAIAYAFAALPARHALERRDWRAAAALVPRAPAGFPWTDAHDAYVAITHFARALGLARLGRVADAQTEVQELEALAASVAGSSAYWARQIEIQALAARAWVLAARGEGEAALASMRQAAALEAGTEKSPVTPGEVLPAAELLGDLLLGQGRERDALEAYEASLARSPGRFNSLYGAARAAETLGETALAREHYTKLLVQTTTEAAPRPALAHAKRFLGSLEEAG